MITRENTRPVYVGGVQIGGSSKVVIQSMTNTLTKDVEATVKQILALEEAGCEIIRVSCLDIEDAKAIREIKKNIHIPIVADIHFDYKIALEAATAGVDKIRINPGNIGSEDRVKAVVDACKARHIPIRIGVNSGSLPKDIIQKYGVKSLPKAVLWSSLPFAREVAQMPKPSKQDGQVTAKVMVESSRRHVDILEKLGFEDIVLSLKASNLNLCLEAYEEAANTFPYPLHLGITHSGTEFSGTVSSSIGLGILLREGIGDTIRVSLSADPVKEIKVAKEILKDCGLLSDSPTLIACPTCGRIQYDLIPVANEIEDFLSTIKSDITVAVMGCAVNGPEEAKHADIGIAGGKNEGLLIKKGEIVGKVKQEDMVRVLKTEILRMIKKGNNS
ncbi:MAG: flavodoxin-dependent (E)-4-hydroxy-3-methylbut-2-enyl-diphosphate synthase [Firmicutes bacterium]|nr:flavodoxin-dependent (E)-4-hydroxy-3-methylbut-2-enyl-diphosphate synthase [Bacillota bacterium]